MLTSLLNGQVLAQRFGSEPARVVALHGWGREHGDWELVLQGLDALALDLPGFGMSGTPPSAWGARDYAKFLSPLIAQTPGVVVVGHSFGGRVVVCLAADNPNVAGIVLTGVPLVRLEPASRPKLTYRLLRALHDKGLVFALQMESVRRRYGSADYVNAEGIMRNVLVKVVGEQYFEELNATSSPVRLVWGAEDKVMPSLVAEHALTLNPHATLTMVPQSGHLIDLKRSRFDAASF